MKKILKWLASYLRFLYINLISRGSLEVEKGKPVYIGKGTKLLLGKNSRLILGSGVYLSDNCFIEVSDGASVSIGKDVYFNESYRIVACDSISIGDRSLFGPNVQLFDHNHIFNEDGVSRELVSAPIEVGEKCWLCTNVVVTSGSTIVDKCLVSANAVVAKDLSEEGGTYGGIPASLIKRYKI